MMDSTTFRAMALGLEDAEEQSHMGHPDFRAGGRVFASLRSDGLHGMVKLTPEQQVQIVESAPDSFAPEAGAWGRQGYTRVELSAVGEEALGEAMTLAWRNVVNRKPASRKTR